MSRLIDLSGERLIATVNDAGKISSIKDEAGRELCGFVTANTDLTGGISLALPLGNTDVLQPAIYWDLTNAGNVTTVPTTGTTIQTGQSMLVSGTLSNASISGGFLIPKTSGTSYYIITDGTANRVINELAIEIAWSGALADSPSTTLHLGTGFLQNAMHMGISASGFSCQLLANGVVSNNYFLGSGNWSKPMLFDGTIYKLRVVFSGNNWVFYGPYGEVFSLHDPRLGTIRGNYVFWEPAMAGTSYPKLRKLYGFAEQPSTSIATPYSTAAQKVVGNQFAEYSQYGLTLNPRTLQEITFSQGIFAGITFGPLNYLVANNLAAITAGATTFSCDQQLPNGTYTFDPHTALGANAEDIIVSSRAGVGPFTITCSAFTKSHAATSEANPVLVTSKTGTTNCTPSYITADNAGSIMTGGLIQINAGELRLGYNTYDASINRVGGSYTQLRSLLGIGAVFGATGAYAEAGKTVVAGAGTAAFDMSVSANSHVGFLLLQPTAAQALTLTLPTSAQGAIDGQKLRMANTGAFTITFTYAGATQQGGAATLTQNQFQDFVWHNADSKWYRCG